MTGRQQIEATVRVEFGRRWLAGEQVGELRSGSLIELDAGESEPVDVLVNGTLIAKGTAVVVDGKFGVYVKEVTPSKAIAAWKERQ